MVPHIMRLIVGPSHRLLCAASFFAGSFSDSVRFVNPVVFKV